MDNKEHTKWNLNYKQNFKWCLPCEKNIIQNFGKLETCIINGNLTLAFYFSWYLDIEHSECTLISFVSITYFNACYFEVFARGSLSFVCHPLPVRNWSPRNSQEINPEIWKFHWHLKANEIIGMKPRGTSVCCGPDGRLQGWLGVLNWVGISTPFPAGQDLRLHYYYTRGMGNYPVGKCGPSILILHGIAVLWVLVVSD